MSETRWVHKIPDLAAMPPELLAALDHQAREINIAAGTVVFGLRTEAQHMLLLLNGTVRVQQTSGSGREIVLYRVEAGESCVMTTACLLSHDTYTAEGIAETQCQAAALPRAVFEDLLATSPTFRQFVFSAFSARMGDLFHLVEEVAFGRIDVRLADRLVTLSRGGDTVQATHQVFATELGTAREVVSRQLTEFQRRSWIAQGRGLVKILDRAALQGLAATL